jgi:hypothetical protein
LPRQNDFSSVISNEPVEKASQPLISLAEQVVDDGIDTFSHEMQVKRVLFLFSVEMKEQKQIEF